MNREELLAAVIAERYGPSLWWKTPAPTPRPALVTSAATRVIPRKRRSHARSTNPCDGKGEEAS